jgi:pimeloyl-ACP methyl ester carboxylesterase
MLLQALLFVLLNASLLYGRDICYGDLGCFTDQYPFSGVLPRPIALLPSAPEKISTRFILYNKQTSTLGEGISANNIGANFDAKAPVKFITHGFIQHGFYKWVIEMKDAILSVDDVNVISVDWSKGNGLPYTQATANSQVVGAEIAKLVNTLIKTKGVQAKDVHLIGHSLGAHISGYAGSKIEGLGRITGLDPAGPYFENTDPIVRLDPSDALFVDAIHTDGTATLQIGLGLMQQSGHVDYYPNGGKNQPGCPGVPGKILGAIFNGVTLNVEGIEDTTACSHSAALTYFTESIRDKNCKFTAYPCSSKADFDSGKCLTCSSENGCNRMGYWSTPSRDLGALYLNTQNPLNLPLCLQQYSLTLYSNNLNNIKQTRGKFTISFKTSAQETSSTEIFDDSDATFKQDSVETRLISLTKPIGRTTSIESAIISFTKTTNLMSAWLYDDKWSFKYIKIASGDNQDSIKLCPTTMIIESTNSVEFKKC